MRAGDAVVTVVAFGTRLSLDTLRPLCTSRAGGAGVALLTPRTGRAGVALRPLGSRVTGVSLGTLRPGVALVALGPVEVAALRSRNERQPGLVGQLGRGVGRDGRVGRDLLRMLVGVDGADEQREAVLLLLRAVDQHGLHTDREHARAHVGVIAERQHHLRVNGTGGPAHRGGIVHDERPLGGVNLLEGHSPALARDAMPPTR